MLVWVFACRTIRILSIPSSFVITSSAFNWNLYGPASIVRAGRFMGILIVWTGIGLVSTFPEFLTILDICLSTSCCSVNFRLAPCKSNMIIFLASNKRWEWIILNLISLKPCRYYIATWSAIAEKSWWIIMFSLRILISDVILFRA